MKYASLTAALLLTFLLTACTPHMPSFHLPHLPDWFGLGESGFPLAEPDYAGKRPRDFTAFEDALSALSADSSAALDTLLTGKTILDIQSLMNEGSLSAEELVTYYVARIRQYDVDKLNAVMELNPAALDIARALDAERADGAVRGPLHGIPVLLKDNIAVGDGTHTTAGAYALRNWQPARDAFLVQQLRAAGAVILGKANLSEWANYSDPDTPNGFSTLGGQTRHPYGPFDPLGSSSGSAVAAAANLATVSVGTETQGSIIAPADANGVVGLKTSRGLVSRDHIIPLVDWMDVPGPIGRNVTDVAVLLSAMTGVDENDAATADAADLAGVDFTQFAADGAAAGKRVAIFVNTDEYLDGLVAQANLTGAAADSFREDAKASDAPTRALADVLRAQGMEVLEVSVAEAPRTPNPLQALEYGFQDSFNRFLSGLGDDAPLSSLADVVAVNNEDRHNRAPYGQDYITGSVNTTISANEYAEIVRTNQETATNSLRHLFDTYNVDVLLVTRGQAYAAAGYPAITVPNGLDENGQPQGVLLVGDFLGEPDLIAVAYAYEQATQTRVEPYLAAAVAEIEALSR